MANGSPIPTPWELYAIAPYQYPLIDLQPVLRIPVVGPEPFNTIAVVRGKVFTTAYRWADGKLDRRKLVVGTNFSLIGFDPRVPPPFKHSTTAALQMIQTSDDSAFVTAVDDVDGFFDDRGNWVIVAHVADLWDSVVAASSAYLSSWVLCFEPPPNPALPHGGILKGMIGPPGSWTIERLSSSSSPSGIEFERLLKRSARRRAKAAACGQQAAPSPSTAPPTPAPRPPATLATTGFDSAPAFSRPSHVEKD